MKQRHKRVLKQHELPKMAEKVLRFEEILKDENIEETVKETQNVKKKKKHEKKESLPVGKRISGRVWKDKKKR